MCPEGFVEPEIGNRAFDSPLFVHPPAVRPGSGGASGSRDRRGQGFP